MKRPDGPAPLEKLAAHFALLATTVLAGCAAHAPGLPRDPLLAPQVERFGSALARCTPTASIRDHRRSRAVFEQALTAATHHSIHEPKPDPLVEAAIAGLGSCGTPGVTPSAAVDLASSQ